MMASVLRFLFGSGWWIVWHLLLWLAAPIFVVLPVKLLVEDTLRKPPPEPTLGTLGILFMPATYYLVACLGSAIIWAFGGSLTWQRAGWAAGYFILTYGAVLAASAWLPSNTPPAGITYALVMAAAFLANLVLLAAR